jgi:hypothetical protein
MSEYDILLRRHQQLLLQVGSAVNTADAIEEARITAGEFSESGPKGTRWICRVGQETRFVKLAISR